MCLCPHGSMYEEADIVYLHMHVRLNWYSTDFQEVEGRALWLYVIRSCKTLIGVHEMHDRMHLN